MIDPKAFSADCTAVRKQTPLVHNITNYVAMNIAANALLAVGASPLMSFCKEEMESIVAASQSLVINIGCIDTAQAEAMRIAASVAHAMKKPWVLDPVGVGISGMRRSTASHLIADFRPTVISGNASEILFLAGKEGSCRGADAADDSSKAVEAARELAQQTGAIVAVSGATDYVTDGETVELLRNGNPAMGRITALGCCSSALAGAFIAVNGDALQATLHAKAVMALAGEKAARQMMAEGRPSQVAADGRLGTGTFQQMLLDALSTFCPDEEIIHIRQ